ncbi:hypothetical protein MOQ72_18930 [Saccharopolyspora sp. K220]|uniref:hypothetical protein n=1 Tax=Saccharopolyspora soli TaxID=2926618 RepID=UPI001F5AED9F|nr:hypothetical protein [Saccharopolyspora soli]MCI2419522.1 hypothetical protein [Saccharopolyspora soli]
MHKVIAGGTRVAGKLHQEDQVPIFARRGLLLAGTLVMGLGSIAAPPSETGAIGGTTRRLSGRSATSPAAILAVTSCGTT